MYANEEGRPCLAVGTPLHLPGAIPTLERTAIGALGSIPERDSHALAAAPGSGPTPDVAALAAPELARGVINAPGTPFPGVPRFLKECRR